MPDYQMSSLVVGGIGKHAFYIIDGYDLITPANNRSFEISIGDWSYNGSSVISRVSDSDTQFGNYCLKIVDDDGGAEEYAQWTYQLPTGTLEDKTYAVYFWAKGDGIQDANIQLYSDSANPYEELGNLDIGLTTLWKPYIAVFTANAAADGSTVYLRFKPYSSTGGAAATGTMYIDNVHMYGIKLSYQLKQATKFKQKWNQQVTAEYLTANKDVKAYMAGSLYTAELDWDYLEPPEELVKHKVYAAKQLLFKPHMDYNWAILVKSSGANERDYFHNRYIGHVGKISLKGLEMLESDPPEIPSGAGAGDMFGSGSVSMEDVIIV